MTEEVDKRGWVPWPYKYLGPGNSLNRGQPFDKADAIAEVHDWDYHNATESKQIVNSDIRFLQKEGLLLVESQYGLATPDNFIGSLLGSIGIGGKRLYEGIKGEVIYPDMSKRKNTSPTPGTSKQNKDTGV